MPLNRIIWTETDEAPALAAYSLLPIIRAFTKGTGIEIETGDHDPTDEILESADTVRRLLGD